MQELTYTTNRFGGAVCDPEGLPDDPTAFGSCLRDSLSRWRPNGIKVVWLEIPIGKSGLVPVAVEAGFTFHHTGEGYLMLVTRLEPDAFVPPYATHYTGAGGVVLRNGNSELLVVSERHRSGRMPFYKLPGGALHPGENLADCVMREVHEETGVETRFEALVCFRHWHGYRYGKSDIYFICRLSPITHEVTIQEEEIEECFWMPVDDYLTSDRVHTFNRLIVKAAISGTGFVPAFVEGYSDDNREIFVPPELQLD
jgi:8-oxo-dGTP pyrophosphatase MutT (NUDIX family)